MQIHRVIFLHSDALVFMNDNFVLAGIMDNDSCRFCLSFQHFLNTMIVYLYISLPYFMTLSVVPNNVQKYISGSCELLRQ
jgi:hypothetical protein